MNRTYPYAAKISPAIKKEVAEELEACITAWQEGRAASPDERDFVIVTRKVLERTLPDFAGTTEEGEQFLADSLFEIQSGGADEQIVTWPEMADYLIDALVAE